MEAKTEEKIRKKAERKAGLYNFQGRRNEIKEKLFVGKFDIFSDAEQDEIIKNGIKNYKP